MPLRTNIHYPPFPSYRVCERCHISCLTQVSVRRQGGMLPPTLPLELVHSVAELIGDTVGQPVPAAQTTPTSPTLGPHHPPALSANGAEHIAP
eukprot:1450537-Amphidinium_carterae.1